MKTAWVVLIISALTDFLITAGTALQASMYSVDPVTQNIIVGMPSQANIWVAIIGATLISARTIQQKLTTTLATLADLKGQPAPEVTKQGDQMVTKMTTQIDPPKEEKKFFEPEQIRALIDECERVTAELDKARRVDPAELKKPVTL